MTFSPLESKVTKVTANSPVTGTPLDTSTYTGDFLVVIRVRGLSTSDDITPRVVFQLVTTPDGATATIRWVKELAGYIDSTQAGQEVKFAIHHREMTAADHGTAADTMRLDVIIPTANTTVVYEAFVVH